MPEFVTDAEGIKLNNVHPMDKCVGRPCVIHNPTDHHMRGWQLHWRDDRKIFERICSHGVGHPDPDQFDYWRETHQDYQGVHGCDGCCSSGGGKMEAKEPYRLSQSSWITEIEMCPEPTCVLAAGHPKDQHAEHRRSALACPHNVTNFGPECPICDVGSVQLSGKINYELYGDPNGRRRRGFGFDDNLDCLACWLILRLGYLPTPSPQLNIVEFKHDETKPGHKDYLEHLQR